MITKRLLCSCGVKEWSKSYESLHEDLQESKKLSASLFGEIETLKTNHAALEASLKANGEKIDLQEEQLADQHDEMVAIHVHIHKYLSTFTTFGIKK